MILWNGENDTLPEMLSNAAGSNSFVTFVSTFSPFWFGFNSTKSCEYLSVFCNFTPNSIGVGVTKSFL